MRLFISLLSILTAVILVDGRPAEQASSGLASIKISDALTLTNYSGLHDFYTDVISIDCGYNGQPYPDDLTKLVYCHDKEYIDTGTNEEVGDVYSDLQSRQANSVRSFADTAARNCYRITGNITKGYKYLIRASFLYGDYDAKNSTQIEFDLYLGVDLWQTMNITDAHRLYIAEVIILATSDAFSVCLVKTGDGIPFISALEVRHIDSGVYSHVNQTTSLRLLRRTNMGSEETIRYPEDDYDRIWLRGVDPSPSIGSSRSSRPIKNTISTGLPVNVDSGDSFKIKSVLMQTAAVAEDNLTLVVDFSKYINGVVSTTFYIYLHFAELQSNESRKFQVIIPSAQYTMDNVIQPKYLVASSIEIIHQFGSDPSTYYLNLTKAPGSTLAPILNAVEAYAYVNFTSIATDPGDVDAMMSIKKVMWVKVYPRLNWQGDPCLPANFSWEKIICNYNFTPPRVISLDLSYSGLNDSIPAGIARLKAIKKLDLSNNFFSGNVPSFLAKLSSLRTLDLSNNLFHGSIPIELCNRQASGLLELRLEDNPCISHGLCLCNKQTNGTRTIGLIVIVVVVLVVLLILLLAFLLWRTRRKRQQHLTLKPKSRYLGGGSFRTDNPHFTYQELRTITNNFERIIGKGGFGTVYYGRLPDDTEVAVKMQRRFLAIGEGSTEDLNVGNITLDSHGIKEFQVEAQLLSRVHHRNLVSLVGYCKDGNSLGLVFEYVAQGSLRDHLSEIATACKIFNWRERLRIAIDAAQGLEYLHKGCKPPIIHRDVKTSNILLSHNFEAKIIDFGLSKAFLTDAHTHVSTQVVAGTPGYVDPEYHNTFRLTEKSDVYSFGIVLLELVTGLPAVLKLQETCHILQWVRQRLIQGNVADVADLRLKRQYDVHSMIKVTDLALYCTALHGNERPTMTEVVMQLKESLQLEMLREHSSLITHAESNTASTSGTTEITSLGVTELSGQCEVGAS